MCYLQKEHEHQDRMQWAVTQAIASAFAKKHTPSFWSYLFQSMTEGAHGGRTDLPFPYDVKYLSRADLDNIFKLAENQHHEAWPLARIDAYQGKDLIAKRAAVSAFLWARYTEYPMMTMDTLKLWHDVEELEDVLQVPGHFRQQHLNCDVLTLWKEKLGNRYAVYEAKHREALQQIQKLMK